MLVLLSILSVFTELLLYFVKPFWKIRQWYVCIPLILATYSIGGLMLSGWNPWLMFLLFVTIFRVINMLRIAKGRMHPQYLWHRTRRTGLVFALTQSLLLLAFSLFTTTFSDFVKWLAVGQLFTATVVLATTLQNIRKTSRKSNHKHYADVELPTVTVAIPARNETIALEACLQSIIANNYPKLEVLVLDDCSHDRTPEIIKKFAQDGVRFIKGDQPTSGWLAKNQAYDKLADEANGELILFCGVDVRFGPEAIRALVTMAIERKKLMISVMPRRLSADIKAAFIQPMRYWWELSLPRRYFNRPAVLSTCWLIDRKHLKQLGGFESVRHAILPEGFFARELVKSDQYSFIRADDVLDVQTRKELREQRETAIRVRYPQLRRKLEMVGLMVTAELLLLVAPFVLLISAVWSGFGIEQIIGAVASLLLVLTHVLIISISNPANTALAIMNFPVAVLTELILGFISMYKYEFSTVEWKGRNICLPVMHTIPPKQFDKQIEQ